MKFTLDALVGGLLVIVLGIPVIGIAVIGLWIMFLSLLGELF
jgi:hypothetical protein